MAEKRMFSVKIIDSDAFLDMPLSTQALYFHLSMRADDDGFLNNAKKIMRIIGSNQNDYDLLVAKRFVIQFADGICVIKHWRINNYLRSDRYKETLYTSEKEMLEIKDNGSYTLKPYGKPTGIPTVDQSGTQYSIDKNSIEEIREDTVQQPSVPTPKARKSDINDLFEKVWKLYPNKKGKGQVKDAQKKRLFDIGYEELGRAIQRYQMVLDKDNEKGFWRHPQNGSTFFNSGYVDYLDKNYTEGGVNGYDIRGTAKQVGQPVSDEFNSLFED